MTNRNETNTNETAATETKDQTDFYSAEKYLLKESSQTWSIFSPEV